MRTKHIMCIDTYIFQLSIETESKIVVIPLSSLQMKKWQNLIRHQSLIFTYVTHSLCATMVPCEFNLIYTDLVQLC